MTTATGFLNEFCDQIFQDWQTLLYQLLHEILGDRVPDLEKDFAVHSILSMLLIPGGRFKSMSKAISGSGNIFELSAWISHVQNFALGGITALKQKYGI